MLEQRPPVNAWIWTSLTTFGLAAGLVGGLLVGMPLGRIANAMVVTALVTCCVGAILGSCQSLGLRNVLARPGWWIVATMLGVGIGLAAGVVVVEQAGIFATGVRPNIGRLTLPWRVLSLLTVGLITGLAMGAAQALVLRRARWVLVTAGALGAAFAASALVVELAGLRFASLPGVAAFVLFAGAAFGAVTSRPLGVALSEQ